MKIKQSILPVLCALMFMACKPETSETTEAPLPQENVPATSSPAPASNPNLVANMSWTFLTDKLFHHRVTVASGKVDENVRKGHWMDFHDNGTYDAGVWGDKTLSGTWTYDDNAKLLELKPSANGSPSQWKVMHKDNNLVLVGTATYGNNSEQVQWIRHDARPDPNAKPAAEDEDM